MDRDTETAPVRDVPTAEDAVLADEMISLIMSGKGPPAAVGPHGGTDPVPASVPTTASPGVGVPGLGSVGPTAPAQEATPEASPSAPNNAPWAFRDAEPQSWTIGSAITCPPCRSEVIDGPDPSRLGEAMDPYLQQPSVSGYRGPRPLTATKSGRVWRG